MFVVNLVHCLLIVFLTNLSANIQLQYHLDAQHTMLDLKDGCICLLRLVLVPQDTMPPWWDTAFEPSRKPSVQFACVLHSFSNRPSLSSMLTSSMHHVDDKIKQCFCRQAWAALSQDRRCCHAPAGGRLCSAAVPLPAYAQSASHGVLYICFALNSQIASRQMAFSKARNLLGRQRQCQTVTLILRTQLMAAPALTLTGGTHTISKHRSVSESSTCGSKTASALYDVTACCRGPFSLCLLAFRFKVGE